MTTRTNERGLTIVPTKLFFERGYAKLEIGIGRGKKLWDKRDSIADRDRDRDARREAFSRDRTRRRHTWRHFWTCPRSGNSMEEGTITRWFKAEGDPWRRARRSTK